MKQIDPQFLTTVFAAPGAPTLASCIERVLASPELSPARRRDLASGLRRLAEVLHQAPANVPADPKWLQPRIAAIAPASLGIAGKSWSNILSNARAGLACAGVVSRGTRLADLSPTWSPLWAKVLASRNLRVSRVLGRFIRLLDNLGVSPADVGQAEAEIYRRALEVNELHRSPEESMRQAVRGWNIAVREFGWWPGRRIELPSRSRTFRLPLESYPQGFQDDVDRFRERMEAPSLLDPDALPAALRPASVKHRLAQLHRFAAAVVHAGVPIASLTSFTAMLTVENVQKGLEWMLERNGGSSGPALSDTGAMIRILLEHCVTLPEDEQQPIVDMIRRIHVARKPGMREKNRDRLRPFQDSSLVQRLLALSERTLSEAADDGSHAAARRSEVGLAIRILLFAPIRGKNLAEIQLERNLVRMADGSVFLRFLPEEVKNRKYLEFELDSDLVAFIDRHLAARSPRLCPAGCPWLFARRDGTNSCNPSRLATSVQAFILRELGVTVHLHLFRHLAAMQWLRTEPGNYEIPRLLLGHSALSSTIEAYADFDQSAAVQLFARVVRKSGTER